MFIVIPYRADTVAKGFPWGTVGLIAANVLVAVTLGFPDRVPPEGAAWVNACVLEFGTLNPLTWITNAFVHFGWMHLIFNMVFLWSFGFIVEGFLGWPRFLAVYGVLVVGESALSQILMLGASSGGAAGASGAIMGLMAMAALWAPRNMLTMFLWIVVIVRTALETTVLTFCFLWIGIDLMFVMFSGFAMSSELLHILGAATGVAVAMVMLAKKWVDTEGWDYLSLRRHGSPRRAERAPVARDPEVASPPQDPRVRALVEVRDALMADNAAGANAAYETGKRAAPDWVLPREDLRALIDALRRAGHRDMTVPRLGEWLTRYDDTVDVRLALAEELIAARRPGRALEHLAMLAERDLDAADRASCARLDQAARAQQTQSGLELE